MRDSTFQIPAEMPDLENLVDQHWNSLCRIAYKLLGDWDDSQDVVIETFVAYNENPPASPTNTAGWLYRVTTNRALNVLRSKGRRKEYEQKFETQEPQDISVRDPEMELEHAEMETRVRSTLQQISPKSAQLLILRFSDFSYKEIAGIIDVSPNSVGTMLIRAEKEFQAKYLNPDRI